MRCHREVKCPGLVPSDTRSKLKVGPQYGRGKTGQILQKAFQKTQVEISQWKPRRAENKNHTWCQACGSFFLNPEKPMADFSTQNKAVECPGESQHQQRLSRATRSPSLCSLTTKPSSSFRSGMKFRCLYSPCCHLSLHSNPTHGFRVNLSTPTQHRTLQIFHSVFSSKSVKELS